MTYYGIVEDRNDPLMIGRVRVRVHGVHTDNRTLIATPDLAWSQVLLPTTAAALSGIGTQHGLVEGSTVAGFFRDKSLQDFVVTHSAAGLPQAGYKETIADKLLVRSEPAMVEGVVEGVAGQKKKGVKIAGFNDPRQLTKADYAGTPDGESPTEQPKRGHGLTMAMDKAPVAPENTEPEIGKAVKITERTITIADLPHYPLSLDGKTSDLGAYHTGKENGTLDADETNYDSMDLSKMKDADNFPKFDFIGEEYKPKYLKIFEQKSKAKPVYPFNKTNMTESGHLIEVDDTKGAERLNWHHRSGTFTEWQPDGSTITRVNKDNYTLVCRDNTLVIGGEVAITVLGNAQVVVKKDAYLGINGDATLEVIGQGYVKSKKRIKVVAPELDLSATEIKLNS
jgi:hypothetical protein